MPSALYCSHGLVPLSLGGVVGGGVPSRKKNWMIGAILTTTTRTYAQCPVLQPWSRTTELGVGGGRGGGGVGQNTLGEFGILEYTNI